MNNRQVDLLAEVLAQIAQQVQKSPLKKTTQKLPKEALEAIRVLVKVVANV